MKTGLVLEGGGMRGLFSEGVFDVLIENGIMLDSCVGVSAGVLFGCNYKSKQLGRALRYNTRFKSDPNYMSWRSLIKTGDFLNVDFAYRKLPLELDVFDFDTFNSNDMEFHVVCTDIVNAKPVYKKFVKSDDTMLTWMRASGSMPLMATPVTIDGVTMLDGGIIDSIPLAYSQSVGCDKNIVILTQPRGYRKKPFPAVWLFRWFLKKYPMVADMMASRHEMYNKEIDYIFSEEKKGNTFIICPDEALGIGRTERDADKMRHCYEAGRKKAKAMLEEIVQFTNTKASLEES